MGADSTDIIARLAGAQHGAVAVRQVIEAGVTRRWIDNLVDRDVLRRTAAGVYVVNGSEPTWHQRLSVGLLSLGDQAWVSFEAAAALHWFDRALREPVDFTVLRELRNRAKACPYRVHTTVTMPPIDIVADRHRHGRGFPVHGSEPQRARPRARACSDDPPGGRDRHCDSARPVVTNSAQRAPRQPARTGTVGGPSDRPTAA